MQIDRLYLRSFRNYAEAEVSFVPGVNLLIGDNANGKTNLLEAIGYLSTAKSFRARKEQELIRFQAEFAELRANVTSQSREQELKAFLFADRRPRRLFLNGVKQKTAAGIAGVLTSVLFCPEDLLVLKKGAQQRRRWIDNAICQIRPNYDAALSEYHRLLEQKSALLRDGRENPALWEVLPEYNLRMAQVGALLISYRARYLHSLAAHAAEFHRDFSGGTERLTLRYKTVSNIDDPFAPTERLRELLTEHQIAHRAAELESGQCLSGPHRDDFESFLNEMPISQFASQGQTRTATISIKLAERALMKRENGEEPVLLLDDVLSELDAGRQDFVLNHLKSGQVFITCCDTGRFPDLGQVLRVKDGKILGG